MSRYIYFSLLMISLISWVIGLFAPILSLEKFWIFDETLSLITGMKRLWQESEFFTFSIVAGFGVIFPLAKYAALLIRPFGGRLPFVVFMEKFARWSMLDVMLVALMVMLIKIGEMVTVKLEWGFYSFTIGVLLSLAVSASDPP